jgi:PAS domain S-box-containing protein
MKIKILPTHKHLSNIQEKSVGRVFTIFCLLCVLSLSIGSRTMASSTDPALRLTSEELQWLGENKTNIRYGPNPYWPPGDYMENGKHKGIVSDYIKIFEKKLGITFQRVYYKDWEHFYIGMMTGKIDFVGAIQRTAERKKALIFTQPFLKTRLAVLTRTDSPDLHSLDELNAKTLAGIKGYSSLEYVKKEYPGAKIIECDDDLTALLKLSAGAADGAIVDYMVASYLVDKYSITNLKYARELDFHWDLRFAINKKKPQLRSILDKVLSTISEEQRQAIYHKWVGIELAHKPSFVERNMKIIIGVFSCVLFLLLVVIFFNRSLKKQVFTRTNELRESTDKLRENKEYLQAVLDAAGDAIIVVDADTGQLMDVNHRMIEMYGYSYKEALLADFEMLSQGKPPFSQLEASEWLRKAREIGPQTFEWLSRHKDGHTFWSEVKISFAVIGRANRFVIAVRDISGRKQIEDQLVNAQKLESVGRLAGGVAHDFNNMLGVILGYTELVMEEMDPSHPLLDDLQQIKQAAESAADVTSKLLAFARKQVISPKVIDLNETVDGMMKMLLRLISEDIDLAWLPGKGLWPIKIDPSQIDQILVNLCVNARDAISGVGKITVETSNCILDEAYCSSHADCLPGQYVKLDVTDNGSGMEKETVAHIFEPFFTTKGVSEGTGLGLATVYGIVQQNSGFVNVCSEKRHGSTFTIYLPRYEGTTNMEEEKSSGEPVLHGNETILLVEDEPALLDMTTAILERLGYTVLAASSPRAAIRLDRVYSEDIHLLLTDVIMPEMNGRMLSEKLLENRPGLKCLFMSGYTADAISHKGVLEDGVSCIQKPFAKRELAAKIRQALGESTDSHQETLVD